MSGLTFYTITQRDEGNNPVKPVYGMTTEREEAERLLGLKRAVSPQKTFDMWERKPIQDWKRIEELK